MRFLLALLLFTPTASAQIPRQVMDELLIVASGSIGNDQDVEIYRTNVINQGGTVSASTVSALNTLVAGLKADSLWTKLKFVAPLCGNDLTAARVLLKKPTGVSVIMANSGSFVSGDYAETGSSGGLKGNGSSKYLGSGYNPVTESDSVNSFHMLAYVKGIESAGSSRLIMGSSSLNGADAQITFLGWANAGSMEIGAIGVKTAVSEYSPTPGSTGLEGCLLITCNGTRTQNYYNNGTAIPTSVVSSGAFANVAFSVGAYDNNITVGNFTLRYLRFITIGTGLSATDASNIYTRIQTFQTSLSRNL